MPATLGSRRPRQHQLKVASRTAEKRARRSGARFSRSIPTTQAPGCGDVYQPFLIDPEPSPPVDTEQITLVCGFEERFDLRQAVAYLGVETLRSLTITTQVFRVFNPSELLPGRPDGAL